jgi:type I site-specific restriction endonuclease
MQMIGRGTRPLPGVVDGPKTPEARKSAIELSKKQTCTVLDFVGNSGNHKLVSVVDVLAGADVDARDLAQAVRLAKRSDTAEDMDALLEKAKNAREAKEREEEEKRKMSTHRKADSVDMRAVDVDLFEGKKFDAHRDYKPSNPNAASPAQVQLMVNLGVSPEKAMNTTKGQAGAIITSIKQRTGGAFVMPFGKYAGKPISQIPSGYFEWMKDKPGMQNILQHVAQYKSERK